MEAQPPLRISINIRARSFPPRPRIRVTTLAHTRARLRTTTKAATWMTALHRRRYCCSYAELETTQRKNQIGIQPQDSEQRPKNNVAASNNFGNLRRDTLTFARGKATQGQGQLLQRPSGSWMNSSKKDFEQVQMTSKVCGCILCNRFELMPMWYAKTSTYRCGRHAARRAWSRSSGVGEVRRRRPGFHSKADNATARPPSQFVSREAATEWTWRRAGSCTRGRKLSSDANV